MFAEKYHIRPWEMDLLTACDFDNLVDVYERECREMEKEARNNGG